MGDPTRRLNPGMLCGIVFVPQLFSWAVMRPGYSIRARTFALTCMMVQSTGVAALVVLVVIATIMMSNARLRSTRGDSSLIDVQSAQLVAAYSIDPITADHRFQGHWIRVAGIVESMNAFTRPRVVVMTGDRTVSLLLHVDDVSDMTGLHQDHLARAICPVIAAVDGMPHLHDCRMI